MARRLLDCRKGSLSVTMALILPVLIGFAALGAEFGHALAVQTENQRVADLAAYAGALAYGTSSAQGGQNPQAAMTAAARNVAALNGVTASAVAATLVSSSPRTASDQAVEVTITTAPVLLLAPVLGAGTSLSVTARSYAEISSTTASPCIVALSSGGTGVTLSGGTSISAPTCPVASNASLTVPCGTALSAKAITYGSGTPIQPCSGISGPIAKAAAADPLSGNAGIAAAKAHAAGLSALQSPTAPTVPLALTSVDFGYSPVTTAAQVALTGCVSVYIVSYTVTCPAGTIIPTANFTVEPGITVNYNPTGALQGTVSGLGVGLTGTTLNISGTLTNKGTLNVGPTIINVAKGIVATGGARTSFAAGMFTIGPGPTCVGTIAYSICNLGTSMTFAGPSSFSINAGVYNAGGSTLALGSGTGNALAIGAATDNNALNIGGGATTSLAETDSNTFRLVGNVVEGGGTCTTFGVADQHDITGTFSVAGGTTLGAGVYSVGGYIAVGAAGGGDVTCNGSTYGLTGVGVTLFIGGASTISGGSCNGASFCVAAGFGNVTLTAPTSGTFQNLTVVTYATGGAILAEGSTSTILAGALYSPDGPLSLSGAASIMPGSTQCLQIVATQIVLSGSGKATASSCFAASSGTTVASASLVQ